MAQMAVKSLDGLSCREANIIFGKQDQAQKLSFSLDVQLRYFVLPVKARSLGYDIGRPAM